MTDPTDSHAETIQASNLLSLDTTPQFVRPIIYGPSGLRKTWWAGQFAELGYNVVYLDGDGNSQVLNSLSDEAKKRVYHFKIIDAKGASGSKQGTEQAVMATFINKMKEQVEFSWNFKRNAVVSLQKEPSECITWRPSEIEKPGTIIVIDSLTAYMESLVLRFFNATEFNAFASIIKDKGDHQIFRDHYNWCGVQGISTASALKTFPCHIITIAHEKIHEIRDDKGKLLKSVSNILATSAPQAKQLPKYYTDCIRVNIQGKNIYFDVQRTDESAGQSRVIPPGNYPIAELTPKKYMELYNKLLTPEQLKNLPYLNFNTE